MLYYTGTFRGATGFDVIVQTQGCMYRMVVGRFKNPPKRLGAEPMQIAA